jgi:hypothetical protein
VTTITSSRADGVDGQTPLATVDLLPASRRLPAVKGRAAGRRSTVSFSADGLPERILAGLPAVEAIDATVRRVTLHTGDPDQTVRALLQRAPQVTDLEVRRAGLDDAFLTLVQEGETR